LPKIQYLGYCSESRRRRLAKCSCCSSCCTRQNSWTVATIHVQKSKVSFAHVTFLQCLTLTDTFSTTYIQNFYTQKALTPTGFKFPNTKMLAHLPLANAALDILKKASRGASLVKVVNF